MESNKDEAMRAKEIAEKKFQDKDIIGSQKFALKAQKLYPGLDGLPQFLTTLDVYISAERKIDGEVDWYGVLGVDPSANDDNVRRQYRKLALALHPDKNKSVGAEGAFKIVSEAWSLLSDQTRRVAYDLKRRPKGVYQRVSTANSAPSSGRNGFHSSASNGNASMSNQNSAAPHHNPGPPPPPPRPQRTDTFWTACARCRMQYEYLRCYLNQTLLCPNCKQPFFAVKMPAPNTNQPSCSSGSPRAANNLSAPGGSCPAPASTAAHVHLGNSTRGREAPQHTTMEGVVKDKTYAFKRPSAAEDKGDKAKKGRHVYEQKVNCYGMDEANTMARASGVIHDTDKWNFSGVRSLDTTRDLLQSELRRMLMDKARREIHKKLSEVKSTTIRQKAVDKEARGKGKEKAKSSVNHSSKVPVNGIAKTAANGVNIDRNKHCAVDSGINHPNEQKISSPADSAVNFDIKSSGPPPLTMNVPDPDFHDFDNDRTEKAFSENQVWAAYDDDDGMPRFYALIRRVVSRNPFKIEISWLNSRSTAEFGPHNWIAYGFFKTCGEFRQGKITANTSINSFSHRVQWTKGLRGLISLYPKKGDVWAVYRNWSPDWNESTSDEVIHEYDMVEVLVDYSEENGVTVVPLVKVAGFKTVFQRHLGPEHVRVIPKEEMFRFSHQVPSYLLTGQESPNAPGGCRELDPAATPLELLNVITETQDQVSKENTEEVKKSTL